MCVFLEKEPDNEVDQEAIKVTLPGLGTVGYVANSPYTVLGESFSAGRIYDRIGDNATGKVLYILGKGIVCELNGTEESLLFPESSVGEQYCEDKEEYDEEDLSGGSVCFS